MAIASVDFDGVAGDTVARRLRLEQMRRRRLWSMTRLGKEAHLATSTILAIERGKTPRLSTIEKISQALGCEPEEIEWPGDPLWLGEGEDET